MSGYRTALSSTFHKRLRSTRSCFYPARDQYCSFCSAFGSRFRLDISAAASAAAALYPDYCICILPSYTRSLAAFTATSACFVVATFSRYAVFILCWHQQPYRSFIHVEGFRSAPQHFFGVQALGFHLGNESLCRMASRGYKSRTRPALPIFLYGHGLILPRHMLGA